MVEKNLPSSLARCFQEYSLSALDAEKDFSLIIGRILEFGTRAELEWLFSIYGVERIQAFVKDRGFRALSKRAFNFWRIILGVQEYTKPLWLSDKDPIWRF